MSRSNPRRDTEGPRQPIRDRNTSMPFGKYKGFTIAELLDGDPGYLVWLHNNTDFELHADLLDEAEGPVRNYRRQPLT